MFETEIINEIQYSANRKSAICATINALEKYTLEPEVELIKEYCFAGNKVVKSINIPSGKNPLVIEGYTFSNSSLEEIILPENTEYLGEHSFENCKNLKSVKLNSNLKRIEPSTFRNCTALEKIVIPEGIEMIYSNAFNGCTSLKEVILPNSLIKINMGVFENCPSLKKIVLPNNVKIPGKIFDDTIEKIYISEKILEDMPSWLKYYDDKIICKPTLDDLLDECKSLREISNIYKACNIEK